MKPFSFTRTIFYWMAILCFPTVLFSQFKFDFNDSIPVTVGNDTLDFAWAGGLNYVQVSDIDFDFDGDLDLFLFDRSRDNIRLFETVNNNGQTSYRFVHMAASYFPSDFKYRVALVDYDGDGRKDAFTYGIGGIKVYRNIGDAQNGLQWQLVTDILRSDYIDGNYNLYVSSSDIPAYVDLDFDSDLDILTFDIGGEHVEYHQNQSMELYGHNDSLKFVLVNECWGKFGEDQIDFSIILNDQSAPCISSTINNPQLAEPKERVQRQTSENESDLTRHAGSTLLAIDIDHSGVYDLVLGDVASHYLTLLTNGGSAPNTDSPMTAIDLNFPSNTTPVNLSVFPAAYFVDVDHDQVKDLIAAPNAKSLSENQQSVTFYKNLGSNDLPNFSYRSNDFLQGEMIDHGFASIPSFFDENGDGTQDLFVSNFYRYKEPLSKESVILAYLNAGTPSDPSFNYFTNDYLGLSAQSYGLRTVPTFGDVDGDLDQDVFLGLEDGTLTFLENTAGAGFPPNFAAPVHQYSDLNANVMTANSYCFPQLFDLNKDGLLDLILGRKTGEMAYYQNVGTSTNPAFQLVNDTLGGVDLTPLTPDGFIAPHFFTWNDTIRLFAGGSDGYLHFYDDVENHLQVGENFHLISDNYLGISTEAFSSCWVNDIDGDGNADLFVGGDLGGIMHLEHNLYGTLAVEPAEETKNLTIFPNPSNGIFKLDYDEQSMQGKTLEVYNLTGSVLFRSESLQHQLDLSSLPDGIYFLNIKGTSEVYKIVKQGN